LLWIEDEIVVNERGLDDVKRSGSEGKLREREVGVERSLELELELVRVG
jgi:hypothetical protein